MPRFLRQFIPVLLALLLAACGTASDASPQIEIEIVADGRTRTEMVSVGSSVRAALEEAGLELGPLDRVEPSLSVELVAGDQATVIRVEEEFETEQDVLPFGSRTLRNESLPEGEERLIQVGAAGSQEITYRLLYEDGELVSRTNVGSHVVAAPVDEIIMVGVQAPASLVAIQGRLAYVSAGNAWLIEGASGQRRAIVTSGDLDGRILRISPDGQWLLFTRAGDGEELINTLWVASLAEGNDLQLSLRAENIVHFADFVPGADTPTLAYSTAEVAAGPPGWQANNDLYTVRFTEAGTVFPASQLLAPRTDSLYTWWGSNYAWSPDGSELTFARPDAVGLVDLDGDDLDILQDVLAFQTESEWAWMPTVAWSPDGSRLYYTSHVEQPGLEQQARSPLFDLVAMDAGSGALSTLANNVGMFAQPQASPTVEGASYLAFLQAINPTQSDVSAYQLALMNSAGGPATILFPPSGAAGLAPAPFSWSPAPEGADGSLYISFAYQGNLWLVDVFSGATTQLTADGLVTAVVWGD
jgi:hypothetical protein